MNYAKLRVELCDIINQVIDYLLQIENKFLNKFSDKDINNFQINYSTSESKLEKALFFLALIYPLYCNSKIDIKEFHSLVYSVHDLFKTKQIKNKLKNVGFPSSTDFLYERINFYMTEVKLFSKMENPHSGKITYFWYQNPLAFENNFDKNVFILFFFSNMVWGEFLSIFEKIIKKYM